MSELLSRAVDTAQTAGKTVAAAAGYHNPMIHGNDGQTDKPNNNLAVIYNGPNKVIVDNIGYPRMQDPEVCTVQYIMKYHVIDMYF